MRILFVCLGNICRSPAAEGVFRALASSAGLDVTVDSAGTSDWHIGSAPYGPMQQALDRRGYDVSDLAARQFTPADFNDFDLIIGMDDANLATMEALRPAGNTTPLRLFLDFADGTGETEVPDPYYTRDYEQALDLITTASEGLLGHIRSQRA